MRDAYNHRLRLVQSARQRSIKPTARLFQTTVPTVRKWLRRYQQQGPRGLIELSRAPHRQPGKTPPEVEQQVVALRQQLFTFGARRLIREFDLPLTIAPWSAFGASTACSKNGSANIRANKTSPTSKPPGASFSKSPPTPRISTTSPATGRRLRPSIYPPSNTLLVQCTAACCSGPLPSVVLLPPAPFLPPAFSSTWTVAASPSATWFGRPTTAPSSSAGTIAVATPPASPPF